MGQQACQLNRLTESVAMELIDSILEAQPSLLLQENLKGQSPAKIALMCQGCPEIEQTFTIVLFRHFQLVTPGRPRYKSATALIHEVRTRVCARARVCVCARARARVCVCVCVCVCASCSNSFWFV
jgi:hypothetical protein